MPLETFDAADFRRVLAGLQADHEPADPEEAAEAAADLVLLLAICFNRRELDAKTLWTRIESALRKAIANTPPEDMRAFVACCLDHVWADANVATRQRDAVAIQRRLYGMDGDASTALVKYLSLHLYPAIMDGATKWDERKATIERERAELEEVTA